MLNILFTSVGRRVELIQVFRDTANEMGISLNIIGVDVSNEAPALSFCDNAITVCYISDKNYIPSLLSICKEEKIDCLIPTIDTDLLLLSKNKSSFEEIGTKVLISDTDKIEICRDKNYTSNYFISLGLKAPFTINNIEDFENCLIEDNIAFPVFIKPKNGSSSIDAYKAENITELKSYANKIKDYIIQPFISGREYTIDIFCDYEGNPVYITPRERLAVRAGEVLKTQIVQDDVMIHEMQILIEDYKPCGQITVQLIRDEVMDKDYYIEINPRFGGGAPLSMKAGANSAEAIFKMLNGQKLNYIENAATDGAMYCRFDQSVRVK